MKAPTGTKDRHGSSAVDTDTEELPDRMAYSISMAEEMGLCGIANGTRSGRAIPFLGSASLKKEASRMANRLRRSRGTELAFGAGGLRGPVERITDFEAYVNTRGFLEHALAVGDIAPGQMVAVAGDLRPSTDGPERSILRAVARAITDMGLRVDHLGYVPTPALTFYAFQRKRPSIMVTGSHAPFDYNGIKFFLGSGELLKEDQSAIARAVERVREIEDARGATDSLFDINGMFKAGQNPLAGGNSQACFDYLCRYLNFLPHDALDGLRIIFCQHSAAGRDLLMVLLVSLGAEVIPVGRSDDFMPIDMESLSEDTRKLFQDFADQARQEHGHFDAIISTDSDSDRPLLAALTPEGRLNFCAGDLLGILTADFLGADAVAVPINANDAVDRWAAIQGASVFKTRIGPPHVIEAMQEARAQGAKRVVGWESNGGFLTATNIERNGRTLAALPSRDAALPLLAALCAAKERRVPLTELFSSLPRRFIGMGIIEPFPVETGEALIQQFLSAESDVEDIVFTSSFVSLRHSDGRIETVSPETASLLRTKCRNLEQFFRVEDGFEQVLRLNTLDGLRIWFSNGDIVHIRPSGTGPRLRIYATADTQARADLIVDLALTEPDGILRRMRNALADPSARSNSLPKRKVMAG